MYKNTCKQYGRQRGVTLIEALVSLFIISIGLLGVAGLQATSLVAGHSSTMRSKAVFYTNDLLERMRSNRDAEGGGVGLQAYGGDPEKHNCREDGDAGTPTTVCAPALLAADDLFYWYQEIGLGFGGTLSPVDGTVSGGLLVIDDGDPNATSVQVGNFVSQWDPITVTITIKWKERGKDYTYRVVNARI